MSERQPILPNPCNNFCNVEDMAQAAFERYDEQAQGRFLIANDRPSGFDLDLIQDPRPVIENLQEQLKLRPCDFTRSGHCGAAAFIVESSLNIKLRQVK